LELGGARECVVDEPLNCKRVAINERAPENNFLFRVLRGYGGPFSTVKLGRRGAQFLVNAKNLIDSKHIIVLRHFLLF